MKNSLEAFAQRVANVVYRTDSEWKESSMYVGTSPEMDTAL